MIEGTVQPNRFYKITYSHAMSKNQVNYVRAISISKAIEKWTEKGEGYHEETDIVSIEVICSNIDDWNVIYWD